MRGRNPAREIITATALLLSFPLAASAVDFASVEVMGMLDAPSAAISAGQATSANATLGTEGFFIDTGVVRGEFPIRIGDGASDDAAGGVLISSVYENGRELEDFELVFATPGIVADASSQSVSGRGTAGGLALTARRGGIADADLNQTMVPGGEALNTNFAAAYFPFDQGWVGGTFSSTSVSGTGDAVSYGDFDQFVGSPELSLANIQQNFYSEGYHKVTIPGVTDSRRQGILLTTSADNVGRFSAAAPTVDGSGFAVATVDNDNFFVGDPDEQNEDDGRLSPVSMVFLPLGTPNITMGSIHGGTGNDLTPTPLVSSGSPFNVSYEDAGLYRLTIEGESPSTGVLLVTPGGNGNGMGGRTADNILTSSPDGDGWLILSQDPEANSAYEGTFDTPLAGIGQDNTNLEQYFNFAFLPFDAPPSAPGEIPSAESLTNFNTRRVFGWNAEITEFDSSNSPGAMSHEVVSGTSDLNIQGLYDNRGDNGVFVDGGFLSSTEGILFATVREGFRDNVDTGGLSEYGVVDVSDDLTGGGKWAIHTHITDPNNGEHNINYAAAYFGLDSGFDMGQKVPTEAGVLEDFTIDGVEDPALGALLLTPHGNDDNYISATPDGDGWDIILRDNGTTPEGGTDEFNYIFLPYETENVIAGQVEPDGSLVNSSDPEQFSLDLEMIGLPNDLEDFEFPVYRLTIPGKTPDTGMLLLTSTGDTTGDELDSLEDNSVVYMADGDDFLILGLDHRSGEELLLTEPEETGFYFAYIDFENPPLAVSLPLDCNGDGVVDVLDMNCIGVDNADAVLAEIGSLSGDADGNGAVEFADFLVLSGNFGGEGQYTDGDFDLNGSVEFADFLILSSNFGQSGAVAAVPEPSTISIAMIVFCFAMLPLRRRGR